MCVHNNSGEMEKVSNPVAAVASVALSPHCSLSLMSHEWVLSPLSLLPVSTNGVKVWCVTWSQVTPNVVVVL